LLLRLLTSSTHLLTELLRLLHLRQTKILLALRYGLAQRVLVVVAIEQRRSGDAAVRINRNQSKRFSADGIQVRLPNKPHTVCLHQSFDARWIDGVFALKLLDGAHVLFASEDQLFFLLPLGARGLAIAIAQLIPLRGVPCRGPGVLRGEARRVHRLRDVREA